jgi:maleylpyruvate isomerase
MATADPDGARQRYLELARSAHRDLLAALDELHAAGQLEVGAPSLLPGWSKGHVITHVTNSGDGHVLMLEAAAAGEIGRQYPHGMEGRAADIEAGAGRPAGEQIDLLRTSIERLEALWATSTWRGTGLSAAGEVPIGDLPFLRIREVAIHHIDLDIGATFADLPADYVRADLRRMEMMWAARQPMGLTALPEQALALEPGERLAWLMGRRAIEGVAPANAF